ncbi:MAG: biotin carboxylase N-terminal domain-containing protein, partial [Pseudomonadales bacterium]|nr:biotin carboxylase N-terminal domain-containing protein [Pseudomonadales bacterium]
MSEPIRRVLIANRGAIATRVQRTLKKLGVESVAVYAEADHASRHVADADAAVSLGEGAATATYLDAERILAAAKAHGAQAIHPGYGFLSENAAFSKAVEDAGLVFLGPTAAQIKAFGLKHEARRLATEAEVPLLPGTGVLASLDDAVAEAEQIGYPVMLKSSAGGGGIGMRVAADEAALRRAWDSVAGMAESSFGDSRLFLERFVTEARHVEVQVFGDGAGRVAILGDRDCSMQRRNQKVIEEAPAPDLPDAVREGMHEAARRLMESVSYRSAGTVEFLYDRAREAYYFLEVNARLQVEHGVTELVTGVDIVEWMVRLGETQLTGGKTDFIHEPNTCGAAIQARVYAEDPARDFRPAPGLVTGLVLPETAPDVRVDDWLEAGTVIPATFDPLVTKILAAGTDREAARKRLASALAETRVDGVVTNLDFLRAALELPDFVAAHQHTGSAAAVEVHSRTAEVIAAGTQTSVQDVEGRLGYWHVGVPPSGAFDFRSLAHGNALLGNDANAAGLEMLAQGPTLRFTADVTAVVTGANAEVTVDDATVDGRTPFAVPAGATLRVGRIATDGLGLRAYLAVAGGLAVPEVLGSRATFDLGAFGGHGGRALRTGDVLPVGEAPEAPGDASAAPAPDL